MQSSAIDQTVLGLPGASGYDEERDVHPLLRANPGLIEEGATLAGAEVYLNPETLRHIDLKLVDAKGTPLLVEVKWSGFNREQPGDYLALAKLAFGDKPFRLLWFVPDDLDVKVSPPIEVKTFPRKALLEYIELRRRSQTHLANIVRALSSSVKVPRTLMYLEEFTFPSVISACYFDGTVTNQKGGATKVGLRKQNIGRHLDLLRCVCASRFADYHPELTLVLAYEILTAPLFLSQRGRAGMVEQTGVIGHLTKNRHSGYYRPVVTVAMPLFDELRAFLRAEMHLIRKLHGQNPDLLYQVLHPLASTTTEMDMMPISRVEDALITQFNLTPTPSVASVHHKTMNQLVTNSVKVGGFERDMAKRVCELATLRRILIPIAGIVRAWLLVEQFNGVKQTYVRTQAQGFKMNNDRALVRPSYRM